MKPREYLPMTRLMPDRPHGRLPSSTARREIALHPILWRMTGAFFAFIGLCLIVIYAIGYDADGSRLAWFVVALELSALVFFVRRPPQLGTALSEFSLALVWGNTALGVVALAPESAAAMGGGVFLGPLLAMRTTSRWRQAAHLTGATLALAAAAMLSDASDATRVVVLAALPGIWLMTATVDAALSRIDAQADALQALLRRDPLTGLGNRLLLDEILGAEVARHRRTERPLSVLMLDLDHFKPLNDTAGHAAGDGFLMEVAEVIRRAVREQDVAIRPGGDEFCVLLPDTNAAGAARVADLIRERIAELGASNGITASVGTATFPVDGVGPRDLLELADARVRAQKGERRTGQGAVDAGEDVITGPASAIGLPQVVPFSRAQLGATSYFWRLIGVAFLLTAGLLVVTRALVPMDEPVGVDWLAGICAAVGLLVLVWRPPGVDSITAHLAVMALWLSSIAGIGLADPAGGAGLALGLSVGQLVALWFTSMRARLAHLIVASAVAAAVIFSGRLEESSMALLALLVATWWQLAVGASLMFTSAEAQGEVLGRLMHRDPLTGAGNRLMLDDRLAHELALHRRTGESLAVFMLDLDGFKAINDEVGHAAGDALLRAVASALSVGSRASDVVVRLGGDEFCVVAPQTTPAEAEQLAAVLTERVAAAAPASIPGADRVATSIGWSTFPHDGASAERLITTADSRLLAAKAERPERAWR